MRLAVKALALVALAGCESPDGTLVCAAPDEPYYECQPIAAATETSCVGGPTYVPAHGPADAGQIQRDPGLVFPDGCHYHLDECGCCYPDGRLFVCTYGRWDEPL
ncbi:MAG TPA: hypothetical protein VGC41_27440 [Kofleriaceae bacterium]